MRILLSSAERKSLYIQLKKKYGCSTVEELSKKVNLPTKTLDGWIYNRERYIPKDFILKEKIKVEIADEKEDGWWLKIGGENGRQAVLKKYGLEGVKKHSSRGGTRAALTKLAREKKLFGINPSDESFLEFYGALLGDGWISSPQPRNKWTIGVCGHRTLDRDFILSIREKVKALFNREGFLRENKSTNTLFFLFSHQLLVEYLSKKLGFPIGKKENLSLKKEILGKEFSNLRHVIRGIFDTDGSFHLEKNKKGERKYPCLSIHMKEPILMGQIAEILKGQEFAFHYDSTNYQIRLKGHKQLSKWMKEIGSSNPKHLNKIAPVAQPG